MKNQLIITGGVAAMLLLLVAHYASSTKTIMATGSFQTASLIVVEDRLPGSFVVSAPLQRLTNASPVPIRDVLEETLKPWVQTPIRFPNAEIFEPRPRIHREEPKLPDQRVDPSRLHLIDSRIQVPTEPLGDR